MTVIRCWLYRSYEHTLGHSVETKKPRVETRVSRGDFEYYRVTGRNQVEPCTRREADAWAAESGRKPKLHMGYPAWMHDLGYRI